MTLVCLKWVGSAYEPDDPRFAGLSPADEVALELALRHGHTVGSPVVAVTAGPAEHERALRLALACGVQRAVRVDLPAGAPSAQVAAALASVAAEVAAADGDATVWCGDYSLDRGSGTVPGFVAAELGWAQALGLVGVAHTGDGDLQVLRRLDGGRRERLAVRSHVVLSVEGSITHLRRASLSGTLAAERAAIEVRATGVPVHPVEERLAPYRPRARAMPAPAGANALERVRAITDVQGGASTRGETVVLDPPAAAARIVAALRGWGYLEPDPSPGS
jgi:electron transfer flavoprotein beta subunit